MWWLLLLLCADTVYAYQFSASAKITFVGGPAKDAYVIVNTDMGEQYIAYDNTDITEVEAPNSQIRYKSCANECRGFYFTLPIPTYGATSGHQDGGIINGIETRVVSYTVNNTLVSIYYASSPPPGWMAGEYIVRAIQEGNIQRQIDFFNLIRSGDIPSSAKCTPDTPIQCSDALDLVLVVDGSGSLDYEDYQNEVIYALEVVDTFLPSANGIHIGYVTFATSAIIVSRLSDNENNILVNKIQNTPQIQGETNIASGLLAAYDVLFNTTGVGYRSDSNPKGVILLTDGLSDPSAESDMIAAADQIKEAGAKLFAVGVGNQTVQNTLELVASSPATQFTSLLSNFSDLATTLDDVFPAICDGDDVQSACASICNPAEVCGCDVCLCPLSPSSCDARGTFDLTSCACECADNWTNGGGVVSDCSICPLICHNGGILNQTTCTCTCISGFDGIDCEDCTVAVCDPIRQTEVPGTCRQCECAGGYSGAGCMTCLQSFCNGHGSVVNPDDGCNDCACLSATGWSGPQCEICSLDCNDHGSANDNCDACICSTAGGAQWTGEACETCGFACDFAFSTGPNDACDGCECRHDASTHCGLHGHLNTTNCLDCICDPDWQGPQCDQCTWSCNGRGSPLNSCDGCACDGLWSGDHCQICDPSLCGDRGTLDPDLCSCECSANFTGNQCEDCDRTICQNGGTLANQTHCNECTCKNSWIGTYCEECSLDCNHGHSSPDCASCICDGYWKGFNCNQCDHGEPAPVYYSAQCSYHGRLNSLCTACNCEYPYNSTNDPECRTCAYNCNSHGTANSSCNGCICDAPWDYETDCSTLLLPISSRSPSLSTSISRSAATNANSTRSRSASVSPSRDSIPSSSVSRTTSTSIRSRSTASTSPSRNSVSSPSLSRTAAELLAPIPASVSVSTSRQFPSLSPAQSSIAGSTGYPPCLDCLYTSLEVSLEEVYSLSRNSRSYNIWIILSDAVVGSLEIPHGMLPPDWEIGTTLQAETTSFDPSQRQVNGDKLIASPVSNITLLSSSRGVITQLTVPLIICLEADPPVDLDGACLGYFNEETELWECEDSDLVLTGGYYCGSTGHLTSFALLLGSTSRSDQLNEPIIWASVALVASAIVLVLIAVLVAETKLQVSKWRKRAFVRSL